MNSIIIKLITEMPLYLPGDKVTIIYSKHLKPVNIKFYSSENETDYMGYIEGCYFDKEDVFNNYEASQIEFKNQGETYTELLDSVDENYEKMGKIIFYINYFEIFDRFKNLGIGSVILKTINQVFEHNLNLKLDNVVLIPDPFKEDNAELINLYLGKLKGFYHRAGFRHLTDEFNYLFLIKNYE